MWRNRALNLHLALIFFKVSTFFNLTRFLGTPGFGSYRFPE